MTTDQAGWVAYGRGRGRPRIGTKIAATVPDAHAAELDRIAAATGRQRPDVIRDAIRFFLAHRGDPP